MDDAEEATLPSSLKPRRHSRRSGRRRSQARAEAREELLELLELLELEPVKGENLRKSESEQSFC